MAEIPEKIGPRRAILALDSLLSSEGWKLLCAKMDEVRKAELDEKIFNPETPAARREVLVAARKAVVESFTPEAVAKSWRIGLENEIRREQR